MLAAPFDPTVVPFQDWERNRIHIMATLTALVDYHFGNGPVRNPDGSVPATVHNLTNVAGQAQRCSVLVLVPERSKATAVSKARCQ
jgi:hypothetical protein